VSALLAEAVGSALVVPLSEVADLVRGVTYPKTDAREEPAPGFVPMLRATNIQDARLVLDSDLVFIAERHISPDQLLRQGDIVVATSSGSRHLVGKSGQLHAAWHGSFGAFCATVRPRPGIHARYLALFLQAPAYWRQITKKALGVNINNLRRGDLESLEVPLPPLAVQARIVAEIEKQFSRLDEAVASLNRVKANLRHYKAAVLMAAVEGSIGVDQAPGTSSRADTLLREALAERRLRWRGRGAYREPSAGEAFSAFPLPAGWTSAAIEQIAWSVEYGSSAKTSETEGGVPVLRMGNIVEGEIDYSELKYLPADHDEFPRLLLEPGDLLFNRTNSPELVGKTAVFRGDRRCSFASYLIRVKTVSRCVPEFVAAYINSSYGRAWVKSVVTQQVGQANVNGTKLRALAIPLPPLAVQQRIVAEVDRRLSIVREVEAEVDANLKRAHALRRAVLHTAFGASREREFGDAPHDR